jgi:hypothetical protein
VARDQDRSPIFGEAAQEAAQPTNARRIEPVCRLVQDQERRIFEQRRGDAESLLHAERICLDEIVGPLGEPDSLQDLVRGAGTDPVDTPEQLQVPASRKARKEERSLDDRPHTPRSGRQPGGKIGAEHAEPSRAGTDEAEETPDRRRLARAVRPEEAEDASLGDVEVEAVQGERALPADAPILFSKPFDLDDRHERHKPYFQTARIRSVLARGFVFGPTTRGRVSPRSRGRRPSRSRRRRRVVAVKPTRAES